MDSVLAKIQAGATILDVRTEEEFAEGAYPGARLIPVAELSARLTEVGDKSIPVIVYCRSGARSGQAKNLLIAHGWKDVTNAGGLVDMPKG